MVESQSTKLKERFESVGYRVMNLLQVCLGAAPRQMQQYWGFVQWEGSCLTHRRRRFDSCSSDLPEGIILRGT